MSRYTLPRNPYKLPGRTSIYDVDACDAIALPPHWSAEFEDDSLAHVERLVSRRRHSVVVVVQSKTTAKPTNAITIGMVPLLRTMWNLLYTAIRHPLTDTRIDMTTGKVIKG